MLLKKIKLENIRSYINQEINFPRGSTLLAGDIGSGKSSILLAIEFALFGLKKKDLAGGSLLRIGKKQGSVELIFEIDGINVVIKRVLKRSKEDVKQDAGYIIINGIKKEATPIELKSMVLELLGYPKELLTKSKDMIYGYTVYTPQEQMKQIIFDEEENRLNILRRLFGIDKYKRIKENSTIFIRNLRDKRKVIEGSIADLGIKQKQKNEREQELKEIEEKLKRILPYFEMVKKELKQKRELVLKKEKEVEEFNKVKKELELNELKLKNKVEYRERNNKAIKNLDKDIENLQKELEKAEISDFDDLRNKIKSNEEQISSFQSKIIEVNKKIGEFELKKRQSFDMIKQITELDKCPVCQQNVAKEHKDIINKKETSNIKDIEEHIKIHLEEEKKLDSDVKELKKKLELLRKKENELEIIKIRKQNLDEKIRQKEEIIRLQEEIKKEIGKINITKIQLNKRLENYINIEEEYRVIKQELDDVLKKEREIELEKTALEKEREGVNKLIISLEQDINSKLKIKDKLNIIVDVQNWVEQYFINLIDVMEKHVMLKIYHEFNELFENWFNILIEDENINVRVNESFTPVVEQNGYEIDLAFLSGGEKTSCALAYRLALNKVINDVIATIKTKNIIILDEPTDGFSTEQLDKLRVVLDQLNMQQIIIVSHESKIESFVDNVVRVTKEEHVSSVINAF
jgi:exonuclease SbcC